MFIDEFLFIFIYVYYILQYFQEIFTEVKEVKLSNCNKFKYKIINLSSRKDIRVQLFIIKLKAI